MSRGSSPQREHLVSNEVESESIRAGPIEIERGNRLLDVGPQFVPRVALCEDVFGQALSRVPAVGFLRHIKHQFGHAYYLTAGSPSDAIAAHPPGSSGPFPTPVCDCGEKTLGLGSAVIPKWRTSSTTDPGRPSAAHPKGARLGQGCSAGRL